MHPALRMRVSGQARRQTMRATDRAALRFRLTCYVPPTYSVEFVLARAAEKTNSHAAEKYRIKGEKLREINATD